MYETLDVAREGHLTWLTLDRPDEENRLGRAEIECPMRACQPPVLLRPAPGSGQRFDGMLAAAQDGRRAASFDGFDGVAHHGARAPSAVVGSPCGGRASAPASPGPSAVPTEARRS